MSADLYRIRVFFEGHGGMVKVPSRIPGVKSIERHITQAPEIPGLPRLVSIDYAPEVQCAQLMAFAEARRDMTLAEVALLEDWLRGVQNGEGGET